MRFQHAMQVAIFLIDYNRCARSHLASILNMYLNICDISHPEVIYLTLKQPYTSGAISWEAKGILESCQCVPCKCWSIDHDVHFLPIAYVVRREGYVLIRVCPSIHPSIRLSVHREGGVPCPSAAGGVPQPGSARGVFQPGPAGRYPCWGVPQPGEPTQGTPPPSRGTPGTGQHMEYLISGGRYASCVHARGLSCFKSFDCVKFLFVFQF